MATIDPLVMILQDQRARQRMDDLADLHQNQSPDSVLQSASFEQHGEPRYSQFNFPSAIQPDYGNRDNSTDFLSQKSGRPSAWESSAMSAAGNILAKPNFVAMDRTGPYNSRGEMISSQLETYPASQVAQTPSSVAIPEAMTGNYGFRVDGTPKGSGYFGPLKSHGGAISTEISIGVDVDGVEMEIPTMVPTLTKMELEHLLSGGRPTDQIVEKALEFARQRIENGLSPFAGPKELYPVPQK